ncbi:MAG: hypothetical protein IK042_00235 [Bacteroidales bacterium]|nr:hypothetical protein [Bacteroidales bacterium]
MFGFPEEEEQDFPFEDEKLQYHPFPALEEGELGQRLKQLEETVNKDITEENGPAEPLESGVNEVKKPSIEIKKELERVILLYSDGSFQSFEK